MYNTFFYISGVLVFDNRSTGSIKQTIKFEVNKLFLINTIVLFHNPFCHRYNSHIPAEQRLNHFETTRL